MGYCSLPVEAKNRRKYMELSTLLAVWPYKPSIKIFGQEIYAYALVIVTGMILAFVLISLLFKRRNMSTDLFLTFFVIGMPIAILTTRLFYCITDGLPIKEWLSWESIREGGLSIVGGIIGGAGSVIAICAIKKVNFFRIGDCLVVGLLLAQSIGRWGNFFNQEVYGQVVTSEWLQWFPFSVFINDIGASGQPLESGTWHYAFFFYESMVTLTAAIVMFLHMWFNPKKPNGINTACYFIVYGLTRSIMEPLRDSTFILNGGGIPWSFVFSLGLLAGGLGLLAYVLVNNKRKEGKIIGTLNGDPYGITKFIGDTKEEVAYFDRINMMCSIYPENYTEKTDDKKKKEASTETPAEEKDSEDEK